MMKLHNMGTRNDNYVLESQENVSQNEFRAAHTEFFAPMFALYVIQPLKTEFLVNNV
jgi:hypothetical protein